MVVALAVVAASCVGTTGTASGGQTLSVSTTGRRVWGVTGPVPNPGYEVSKGADGRVNAVRGEHEISGDGTGLRVKIDLGRVGEALVGSISVIEPGTEKAVTGLVNTPAPLSDGSPLELHFVANGTEIYSGDATPTSIDLTLTVATDNTTTSTPSTTTTTTTVPVGGLTVNTADIKPGTIGIGYSAELGADYTGDDLMWSWEGDLPAGLDLDTSGRLTGIPSAAGSYPITVYATTATQTGSAPVTITIAEQTGRPTPTAIDDEGSGTFAAQVAPDQPVSTTFEMLQTGSVTLANCGGDNAPAQISLYGPTGVLLGVSVASTEANCTEIDPASYPEQAWAANLPPGTYTATLSFTAGATARAGTARALSATNPIIQWLTILIDRVLTAAFQRPTPTKSYSAKQISGGNLHSCAVTSAGGAKCWGRNVLGQLGSGDRVDRWTPIDVVGLTSGVTEISAGHDGSCALTTSGGVKCWGRNEYGQLGNGDGDEHLIPVDVVGLSSGVAQLEAGNDHTCVVTTGGGVKCWGYFPVNETTNQPVPVDVAGLEAGVVDISVGNNFTCALMMSGGVKCLGSGGEGQLGDGGTTNEYRGPVEVSGLGSGVVQLSSGPSHTCAVTSLGEVKCWGANNLGQLGNNGTPAQFEPVNLGGLSSRAKQVSAGAFHTCALLSAGSVKCWGYGYELVPVGVNELSDVVKIAAGDWHTCALRTAGEVKCWGYNAAGGLGNNTTTSSSVPVDVAGLSGTAVAVAQYPRCGPGGAAGTAADFYRDQINELAQSLAGPYNLLHATMTATMTESRYKLLKDDYTSRPDPTAEALKTASLGVVDNAIGAIPVIGNAWGIGRSIQDSIYAYADAVRPVDTSFHDSLEDRTNEVINKLLPAGLIDINTAGDTAVAQGLASPYLNEFVTRLGRCPTIEGGAMALADRARFSALIYLQMFPGTAGQAYKEFGNSLWVLGTEFIKGGMLKKSMDDFFSITKQIHDDASDHGLVVLERDSFSIGERETYVYATSSVAQIAEHGLLSLPRSKVVGRNDWYAGADNLGLFSTNGFTRQVWANLNPNYNPLSSSIRKIVVIRDNRLDETDSGGSPVRGVWIVAKGTPLAEPNLNSEFTKPAYSYPVA